MFDRLYVELENDMAKYIYGSISKGKIIIKNWGVKNFRNDCFAGGKVMDEIEFVSALSGLRKELKISKAAVYLTVKDESFITRPVELPILKETDVEKHLSLETEQYLPIKKNDYQVDFRVTGRKQGVDKAVSSIMVSAGPKEHIENILKCFDRCGLNTKVIDVYPNNICRLVSGFPKEDFAVIDAGRNSINITIFECGEFYMHSYIPENTELLFEEFLTDKGIDTDEFRHRYFYNSLSTRNINRDEAVMEDSIRKILSVVLERISRCLDYFNSRHFGKTVDNVYIIGEYGMLKGLKDVMSTAINTGVSIGLDAFDTLYLNEDEEFQNDRMGYYGILGMMLRGRGL